MKNKNQNMETRLPAGRQGYVLVELIVAVGLFALVMTLASGAYLMMIGVTRQTQSIATGIDNLSFALETMVRTIRTGTNYICPSSASLGSNCSTPGASFSVRNDSGVTVSYSLLGGVIQQTKGGGSPVPLTDPSVTVSGLTFTTYGNLARDAGQARVTIVIWGSVSSGSGGKRENFAIETGATMRGIDI